MLTPSGKLFGRTLAELCEDDILPKPVLVSKEKDSYRNVRQIFGRIGKGTFK